MRKTMSAEITVVYLIVGLVVFLWLFSLSVLPSFYGSFFSQGLEWAIGKMYSCSRILCHTNFRS